jgi:hypothetical protein
MIVDFLEMPDFLDLDLISELLKVLLLAYDLEDLLFWLIYLPSPWWLSYSGPLRVALLGWPS